ncbi:MAG: hypothetical protein QOI61_733 [Actinomycetota bacterium]|jgi:uncharacterized RDD family membrane protein YckC
MESLPSERKPGPWPRLGARIIDGFVLLIPVLLVTVPISGEFRIGTGNDGKQVLATAIGVLLSYAYFVLMESSRGSTVGKSALGLHVTAGDSPPTIAQSARRNGWMLVSIIPGSFGGLLEFALAIAIAVSINSDPAGRGFHDRYAEVALTRD